MQAHHCIVCMHCQPCMCDRLRRRRGFRPAACMQLTASPPAPLTLHAPDGVSLPIRRFSLLMDTVAVPNDCVVQTPSRSRYTV